MNVTIKDVAKKAGVATSTVSRVLSNSPRISKATHEKVRKAMEELGYYPNLSAKNLVKRSTETLGIIMPRSAEDLFVNPFFPEVIRGIQALAQEKNYDLLMVSGRDEAEEKKAVEKIVYGKRCDGVLLLCSRTTDPLIEQLDDEGFPFVVIGKPATRPDVNWVDNDNVQASYVATKHLLDQGYRRIGFVSGSLSLIVSLDRLEGYKKALKDQNIAFNKDLIVYGDFDRETGYQAFKKLLTLEEPPDSVIAVDDVMALGVSRAAQELNLRLPEDLAIVGFNNTMLTEYTYPPITSVDIKIYDLGYQAAKLLINQIENPDAERKHVIVPTGLIVRKSSCLK